MLRDTKLAHSRALASSRVPGWRGLSLPQRKDAALCFCKQGAQSPYHIFSDCAVAKLFLLCGLESSPHESVMDVWSRELLSPSCDPKHLLFNFRFFTSHFLKPLSVFKSSLGI